MAYNGLAIDISNYTGQLTQGQIAQALAANVGLFIVRLSLETARDQVAIARQQIRAVQQGGGNWQGYFWCYYDQDPAEQIRTMHRTYRDLYAGYDGSTLWMDDEDEETLGAGSYPWLLRAGRAAHRFGFVPGIYTRRSLWNGDNRVACPDELKPRFARWPLWLAEWSANPDLPPVPLDPFGGPVAVQYGQQLVTLPGWGPYDSNKCYGVT